MTDQAPQDNGDKKDVVPSEYRERYKATGGTNGDFIAATLQEIAKDGVGSLQTVMAENGIEKDRWSGFNPGMQRMNLANVLRGTYLKGGTISVLGKKFNIKHQLEDFTGKVENNEKFIRSVADYLNLNSSDRVLNNLRRVLFEPSAEEKAEAKAAAAKEKADAKAAAKAEKDATKAAAAKEKADAKEAEKAKKTADKEAAATAKAEAKAKAAQEKADAKAEKEAAKAKAE